MTNCNNVKISPHSYRCSLLLELGAIEETKTNFCFLSCLKLSVGGKHVDSKSAIQTASILYNDIERSYGHVCR